MSDTHAPLVQIEREIEASADTVWSILSTPKLFSAWLNGDASFDAHVGSSFRVDFPSFGTAVAGEVVAVDEPARTLSVTWGFEAGPQAEDLPVGASLVEFRVVPVGKGCRIAVTQSRLPSEAAAKAQRLSWTFQLTRLGLFANRRDLESGLERSLASWFSAWNDRDADSRMASLRSCCSDDIEFRDDWTSATGVEVLSKHIGNFFHYVPDFALEPTDDVRVCRGEVLVGWRGKGPDGPTEGHSHLRVEPDGTIVRTVGFAAS